MVTNPNIKEFFWFEAQTGLVWDYNELPTTPSNYHRYLLHDDCRKKVETAVALATPDTGGLHYPSGFLGWLAAKDQRR